VNIFTPRVRGVVAITLLATVCVSSLIIPHARAARVNPDSPKGKWVGTYQSEDGMQSGNVTLTITKVKFPRGSSIGAVSGQLKLGSAKGKLAGAYISTARTLGCGTLVRRGTAASLDVVLSGDGNTLTGGYGTNTVPGGGNQVEGTVTLTRR
jgi:hypothetical protein